MSRSSILDPLDPDGTATAHDESGKVVAGRWHQSMGMGVFLEGPADNTYFQHGGANLGYRCYMLGYLERPLAIAIMTNSEVGDRITPLVIDAVLAAYAR